MIQRRVTVLVTDGGPNPARAARQITSTIPIIGATLGGDPVGDGLVASNARPGGNVTGFTTAATDVAAKRLEYMKAGIPGLKHVGVLWNRGNAPAPAELTARAAEVLGVRATLIGLDLSSDLDAQITAAARAVDGLVLVPDGALFHRRRDVVAAVTRYAIPAIYPEREYVEAGGLMSYGPIIADNFRGAADYVDKVLRGAKVEELPVQDPARLELIVNLRVARALALMITDVVLTRADEVIE
jgi:putative ABC transport system substrate-binding protein